ncbi:MAG: DUF2029 domain-containing protein [Gemmatimonadaceae bacterium]|nr:DUF2029 domain-containing protein [Gemmatimonadaceae bacterium]
MPTASALHEDPGSLSPFTTRQLSRIVGSVLLMIAVAVGVMISRTPLQYDDWGTKDFIEYWAANQVALGGENPYDPARLLAVEQAAGRADDVPLMMWNPPWLLVLMRPVLQRSYGLAASTWMGVNVVMATLACLLIASGYRRARLEAIDFVPAALGSLLSMPALMAIERGQVGFLLLLVVATAFWSIRHKHDLLAGAALSVLTVKPHLFFLVAVFAAILIWRERRWRIAIGAACGTGLLLLGTIATSPALVKLWWLSVISPPAGALPAYTWKTPTLAHAVRDLLLRWTGNGSAWPLQVIPIVAVVLFAIWLWRRSRMQTLDELFPLALCLSVIAAPFGWTFDHAVLAVPQVIIFLRAFGEVDRSMRRWALSAAILLCHLGIVVQLVQTGTDYSGFWWFPLAILAVWLMSSAWVPRSPSPAFRSTAM